GGERANLRAAQPHVAVSRPDTLTFLAARQLEVAREHIARVQRLALARIGQPSAAALAQLATVIVAVAWVITPTRIEVHSYLRLETLLRERTENGDLRRLQNVSKTPVECGGLAGTL